MDRFHRYPKSIDEFAQLEQVIEKYLLVGYLPPEPIIDHQSRIVAMGSCFAGNMHRAFQENGIPSEYVQFNDPINSPKVNRTFFEYVADLDRPYAHDVHAQAFPPDVRKERQQFFRNTDTLIFTVGMALTWFFKGTDVTSFSIDPAQIKLFEHRFASVAEAQTDIEFVLEVLRNLNPKMKIVLTLSPVPLLATLGPRSAMATDCLSKSTLRLALEAIIDKKLPGIYYWPSYEIVRSLSCHTEPTFGADDKSPRHVNNAVVDLIVKLFSKHFVKVALT